MPRRELVAVALSTVLLALGASPLLADKHIVEQITLENGKTAEAHTWLGAKRMAYFDPLANITTIVRHDIQKVLIVMHDGKQVIEADLPLVLPPELAGLFSEVNMSWRTSKIDESRTIGDRQCRKVVIRGRGTVSVDIEMWVTDAAGLDAQALHSHFATALKLSPLFHGLGDALAGLDGSLAVEVSTTINKLGIRSSAVSKVLSITNEPPQPESYEPPKDYERVKLDFSSFLAIVRAHYSPGIPPEV
jgi:hypothetical protein